MTKEEIIEGNVIIATYLGQHAYDDYFDVEKHEYPDPFSYYENATDTLYHKSNLNYDWNWTWLDDAIEEIQKIDKNFKVDYSGNIINAFNKVISWIENNK